MTVAGLYVGDQIDNVLFMHDGLSDYFVKEYVPAKYYNNVGKVIETINGFSYPELWNDISPLWCRPQYNNVRMYKPRKLLQVVGHTPVKEITRKGNLISCDVFSTDRERNPVGSHEFLIIDTESWRLKGIRQFGFEVVNYGSIYNPSNIRIFYYHLWNYQHEGRYFISSLVSSPKDNGRKQIAICQNNWAWDNYCRSHIDNNSLFLFNSQ